MTYVLPARVWHVSHRFGRHHGEKQVQRRTLCGKVASRTSRRVALKACPGLSVAGATCAECLWGPYSSGKWTFYLSIKAPSLVELSILPEIWKLFSACNTFLFCLNQLVLFCWLLMNHDWYLCFLECNYWAEEVGGERLLMQVKGCSFRRHPPVPTCLEVLPSVPFPIIK